MIAAQTGKRQVGLQVAKFDKYFLSQLLMLFSFFSLILVLVYWVNRAVVLFDQIIANGHSAMVFLEFTALTLPNVIRLVLPMAAFAAVVYSTNRLASDSELVIVQATGYSPYRLARPVLIFGILVGLFLSILTHVLVPASLSKLAVRTVEIQENMTARLLREGTFLHPVKGITFFIREIDDDGRLLDIFLSDGRVENSRTDYSASSAIVTRSEGGIKLIMFDGMVQNIDTTTQNLSITRFTDFVFNIDGLTGDASARRKRTGELSTAELLWPSEETLKITKSKRAVLIRAGHDRISQALLCVVSVLIGFSAMLIGGFSRFGMWRQITLAIVMLILIKLLDNFMNEMARHDEANWPLVYLASAVGLICAYIMLWLSTRPALFFARRRGQAI
ncbi:MAG: LPS export ABC transporter permease LptF [Paracoccaceae bacterium]